MIISHEFKFIFFHIPKTGGTSIRWTLRDFLDPAETVIYENVPEQHSTFMDCLREMGEEKLSKYFKFAFVRNPWDLCVSNYFFCKNLNLKHWPSGGGDFRECLEAISKLSFEEYIFSNRLTGIMKFIKNSKGEIAVDFLGRYENLNQDFAAICSRTGMPPLPLKVANVSSHENYTQYYTEATLRRVQEVYRKEIELFGYEFGSS